MTSPTASIFDRAHNRIEAAFRRWGEICFDHPWRIIVAAALTVAFFSGFLKDLSADLSTEGYLHESDPARQTYDAFQYEFGRDEKIIALVESDGEILDPDFLNAIRGLHEEFEALPHVEKVDSLVNARLTLGRDDELIVRDLLAQWPRSPAELDALRATLRRVPLYRKLFVNDTLTRTALILTPDTFSTADEDLFETAVDEFDFEAGFDDDFAVPGTDAAPSAAEPPKLLTGGELTTIVLGMVEIAQRRSAPGFQVGLAGSPYMTHQFTYVMGRDMFLFSAGGILVIAALLFVLFRRAVMVVLPVTVAALSLYFTFCLMGFFGVEITPSVQILPSLLLAVGVGNCVHIFTAFYQSIDAGDDKRQALSHALAHSGLAVVMTGLTTAGGLVSFITANMKPVSDIGVVSPMGIISTLIFSIVLLPALIAVVPVRARKAQTEARGLLGSFLAFCARISTRHPRRMVAAWFALIAASLVLVAQLEPSHYPLTWFAPDNDMRVTTEKIDADFGGATHLEIVVDSGVENGLHDPALLHAIDRGLDFVGELEIAGVRTGSITSVLDVNKELHQALNANDPAYYRIPDERELIAQELLLFENSGADDLQELVNPAFSKARVTVRMPFIDGIFYPEFLTALEAGFLAEIGDRAEVTFTGIVHILSRTVKVLIGDTIRAYLLAVLIISPLMMLLVGSVRTGLVSMIPNLAPIVITLALMALLEIPLDAFTLLVGSIALGLAVDDTIHFMHNYQRFYVRLGDSGLAVQQTLRTTGKALLTTSLVLACGFFVNLLGEMSNLRHFGLLTGFCIIMAFLADALLAPALVTLLSRYKERKAS